MIHKHSIALAGLLLALAGPVGAADGPAGPALQPAGQPVGHQLAGDSGTELFLIASGLGVARRWTPGQIQEALLEDERALARLYLDLDEVGSGEGLEPGRLDATEMVVQALGSLNRDRRWSAVITELGRQDSLGRRLAAWVLEGEIAELADLLFELAAEVSGQELGSRRVQQTFTVALGSILQRRAGGQELVRLARSARFELGPAIVEAVRRRGGEESLELLLELHEAHGGLQLAVLEAIPDLGACTLAHGPEWLIEALREDARQFDPVRNRLALAGLGELRHLGTMGLLLEGMRSTDDPRLAMTARRAAARIVGRDLGSDPEAWRRWLDEQRAWERDELPQLLEELRGDGEPAALRLALELAARRPAHHARLVGPVARHLRASDPGVVHGAARALRALGAPTALPPLVDALDRTPSAQRQTLLQALQELSGERLPAHTELWLAYLRGEPQV